MSVCRCVFLCAVMQCSAGKPWVLAYKFFDTLWPTDVNVFNVEADSGSMGC